MKIKVLIAEDESLLALSYKLGLEKRDCEVVGIVDTGEKAVVESEKEHPDVVLMDIKLAGIMDGIEAARLIMEKHGISCLIITGNTDEGTKNRALELVGPKRYIQKPVDSKKISIAVQNTLTGD